MHMPWLLFTFLIAACVGGAAVRAVGQPAVVKDATPGARSADRSLFDGRTLGDWEPTPFGGEGEVTVADGVIRIARGSELSGITWRGPLPEEPYEISLEARRVDGHDFFCGLTFPVADSHCSLILGGWGGAVVGLSSIDGNDAANNATTQVIPFDNGRWYEVRVRVSPERIECLLDGKPIVDQPLDDHTVSVRSEVAASIPLGIATFSTAAEVRGISWRPLAAEPAAQP
jgi:hypothetical protein